MLHVLLTLIQTTVNHVYRCNQICIYGNIIMYGASKMCIVLEYFFYKKNHEFRTTNSVRLQHKSGPEPDFSKWGTYLMAFSQKDFYSFPWLHILIHHRFIQGGITQLVFFFFWDLTFLILIWCAYDLNVLYNALRNMFHDLHPTQDELQEDLVTYLYNKHKR